MKSELPLATRETQLVTQTQEPSLLSMLQGVLASPNASENAAVVEKMLNVYERMEAKRQEQAFNIAFCAMSDELPEIVASSIIPNRGKYEKYEDVLHKVGPIMRRHRFSVTFSQSMDGSKITEVCHLMHGEGHSKDNSFTVRVGGKADSDTQADCKASTTAKRNAFLNALNIVIRQDCLQDEDEPHNVGSDELITDKEAADLRDWVESTESDVGDFLKYAGAESFETIRRASLERCHSALLRKENELKKTRRGGA